MRLRTLGFAALLAATIVPMAAPAQAAWPVDCVTGGDPLPELSGVTFDSQGAHVYPSRVADDVAALDAWAYGKTNDAAWCLENGIVSAYGACLGAKAAEIADSISVSPPRFASRYVRYSSDGLHVMYPVLLEDLRACAP